MGTWETRGYSSSPFPVITTSGNIYNLDWPTQMYSDSFALGLVGVHLVGVHWGASNLQLLYASAYWSYAHWSYIPDKQMQICKNVSWLIPGCKDIENQLLRGNYMLCNISNNLASYDSFNMVVTAAFVDVFTVATRSMQHLRLLKISHTHIGWTPSYLVLPLVFQKPDNLPKGILKPVGFTLSFTAL